MLKRRILDAPNQDIYHENNFVTKVKIELLLKIGELTSFDARGEKKKQKKLSTVHEQDAQA